MFLFRKMAFIWWQNSNIILCVVIKGLKNVNVS